MAVMSRTERLRYRLGRALEVCGSLAVLGFGLLTIFKA